MLSRRKNLSRLDINTNRDVEAAPLSPSRTPGPARLGLKLIFVLLLGLICASLLRGTSVTPTTCKSDDPGSYIPDNVPRYHGPSGAVLSQLTVTSNSAALATTVRAEYGLPDAAVEFPERFTLIINSYKRHELLKGAIAHYSECSRIDAIRVVRLAAACRVCKCLYRHRRKCIALITPKARSWHACALRPFKQHCTAVPHAPPRQPRPVPRRYGQRMVCHPLVLLLLPSTQNARRCATTSCPTPA